MIETLASHAAEEALAGGVLPRGAIGCPQLRDAGRRRDAGEGRPKLAVVVADLVDHLDHRLVAGAAGIARVAELLEQHDRYPSTVERQQEPAGRPSRVEDRTKPPEVLVGVGQAVPARTVGNVAVQPPGRGDLVHLQPGVGCEMRERIVLAAVRYAHDGNDHVPAQLAMAAEVGDGFAGALHRALHARPGIARVSARRESGFTLIELVVAMTLLAIMMVMLYSGLSFALRSWDAGDTNGRRTADRRIGENFLRRELTFNPDGILCGAKHAVVVGHYLYISCDAGLVVEPAGAAGIAAAKKLSGELAGKRVAVIITGASISADAFERLIG